MLSVINSTIFAPKIVFSFFNSRSISGSCTIRIFILTRRLEALRIVVLMVSDAVLITAISIVIHVQLVFEDFILFILFDLFFGSILLWFGIPAHSNIWIFWVLIRSSLFGSNLFLAFFIGWFLLDLFLLLTLSIIIISNFFFIHISIKIVVNYFFSLLLNVVINRLKGVLTSILSLSRLCSLLHCRVRSICIESCL